MNILEKKIQLVELLITVKNAQLFLGHVRENMTSSQARLDALARSENLPEASRTSERLQIYDRTEEIFTGLEIAEDYVLGLLRQLIEEAE